jgi:energy-converting hydrogenase Eha subunit C
MALKDFVTSGIVILCLEGALLVGWLVIGIFVAIFDAAHLLDYIVTILHFVGPICLLTIVERYNDERRKRHEERERVRSELHTESGQKEKKVHVSLPPIEFKAEYAISWTFTFFIAFASDAFSLVHLCQLGFVDATITIFEFVALVWALVDIVATIIWSVVLAIYINASPAVTSHTSHQRL